MTNRTKGLIGLAAAVVAAVAAVLALFVMRSDNTDSDVSVKAGIGCTGQGDAVVTCYQEASENIEEKREAEVIAESERFAKTPPKGTGPWPFVVVRTNGIGLKVRTTPVAEGTHINGIAELNTAWAVCQLDSGFDPDPATGNGPIWLKIKWDHQTPGAEFRNSDYAAKAEAWAYRGYLVPVGHNGDIPPCQP